MTAALFESSSPLCVSSIVNGGDWTVATKYGFQNNSVVWSKCLLILVEVVKERNEMKKEKNGFTDEDS